MQTNSLRSFNGAVAIISGGASGIGRTMSEELAKRGASVVLADRQVDLAQEVAEQIISAGGKASAIELDVTDYAATKTVVEKTVVDQGRLDYMFNNAGIGIGGEVRLYEISDWEQVVDVNVRGVFNGVQAAYQVMVKQRFGHIVNTASMAGLIPSPGIVSYALSKHAVVGLTTSLRVEGKRYGVRVSALCPGVIRTAILDGGGKFGKSLEEDDGEKQKQLMERLRPMDAGPFAVKAIDAIAKNKPLIVIPGRWKLFWWANRISPYLALKLAESMFAPTPDENSKKSPQISTQ